MLKDVRSLYLRIDTIDKSPKFGTANYEIVM